MKNPYRKGKKIHPLSSPTTLTQSSSQYYLSLLPATLLSLTTSLSADDIQVLAYLISCSNTNNIITIDHTHPKHRNKTFTNNNEHKDQQPLFECHCFWCYTRFWAKWDKSPNREVIDKIIEGYEDGLFKRMGGHQSGRNMKKGRKKGSKVEEEKEKEIKGKGDEFDVVEESGGDGGEAVEAAVAVVDGREEGEGSGGVRKFVSLMGEKLWSMWNRM